MDNYAILLLDEGGIIEGNKKAGEMFGVPRKSLVGKTPYEFSPDVQPDGRLSKEKALEKIRLAFSGQPQVFEWKHRKAGGELFDTEISLDLIKIDKHPMLVAILRDISATKKAEEERQELDQMFRSIVENSHSSIFTIDEHFKITYANDMTTILLGFPNDKIVGRDFRDFLDAESAAIVGDNYVRRQRGENPPSRYEFNIVNQSGEKRRVEISSTMFRDPSGRLRTVGQVLDVTERRQTEEDLRLARESLERRVIERTAALTGANAQLEDEIERREKVERALRRSETKYRHLVESGNTIILEMDTEGRVAFFNQFAERFFGFSQAEIMGKSVIGTIVPARDSSNADLEEMIRGIVSHPEEYRLNENENMKKSGERVWVVWTNQPVFDESGQLREVLCVGIDRSELKKSEQTLAAQALQQATVEERARLARDLHDAVSQTLFSASIIAEVLPRIWEHNPSEGRRRLEEVRQLTRGALAEMRTLLFELRPATLAEADLGPLLHQLAESVTGRARIPVEVTVTGDCDVPTDVKIGLYRIAQEALNNVGKHSGAAQAKVELTCFEKAVSVSISDNGKGFDPADKTAGSLGMGIMNERARAIGAELKINSKTGQGTTVTVKWQKPVKEVTNGGN
ncbi:two-component system, NarL family, nitrate/nitrite sensor histidine kinase NarX [Dehalogenimonas formicexedens]|uniref:Two-component system, NarL family, nitrate/nitrite sensor histidine kinase NarX n=1 Tax=Dehalogenimonas formicexedens TaxID=1839801 RepID=A0A1P8F6K3_9CHLR|nr:PAS domain S-box protein [Dehalogenimonas formicexedens]APV44065.1 two-component system, NarL family, nitrate/nitrite sensor histidine kinase NarX [Dehalogenimonas formicexedens]